MMSVETLQTIAETRRSIYMLNDQLPVSKDEVVKLVEHAVLHTPSAFNSQSSRLVVLFGEDHQKLWQITEDLLRAMVNDDEKFKSTADKMAMFKAGAGTILYFEDQSVIKGLQEQFPLYAHNFPVWAEHTSAMHQYAIWNALAALNIGANLQHYNGVIDEKVAETWNIDSNWKLIAQMVFGGIAAPAGEKTFEPIEKRLKVYGK
ncbi:MAG: nitroreductase family protein [Moraxella sp.]|nr:nitroreductase family protein [Moraxella sp.]MBP6485021.1 nitroreductase family protein [Moraxella sp.]MBP7234914.1 nitroreductase family protein [Moraxella sp.]